MEDIPTSILGYGESLRVLPVDLVFSTEAIGRPPSRDNRRQRFGILDKAAWHSPLLEGTDFEAGQFKIGLFQLEYQ